MIQAYAYTDDRGQYVPADEVVEGPADASGEPTFTWNGEHANREFGKMGKSLKNIVTPGLHVRRTTVPTPSACTK